MATHRPLGPAVLFEGRWILARSVYLWQSYGRSPPQCRHLGCPFTGHGIRRELHLRSSLNDHRRSDFQAQVRVVSATLTETSNKNTRRDHGNSFQRSCVRARCRSCHLCLNYANSSIFGPAEADKRLPACSPNREASDRMLRTATAEASLSSIDDDSVHCMSLIIPYVSVLSWC
ncbi:hypothetical protein NEOLEDRAFT_908830 [Neolentinus lepideus HHB14362 ss-1]|uniref:Uncharacterized protein n=1 Tax=Neolentinus lepideus HHB14362 ss-1 TaxID=1314782 RepID=A0A165UJV3_9AGAM|nr:hypothetical protein NEOLEDRAFT_908830 [Neolentinus lepideus HHB14362 ss-1]